MTRTNQKKLIIAILGAVLVGGIITHPALASNSTEVHRKVEREVHRVGPKGGVLDRHVKREFHREDGEVHRLVKKDVHRVGPKGGVLDKHVKVEVHREDGIIKRIIHRDILRIFPNGRKVERHVDKVKVVKVKGKYGY